MHCNEDVEALSHIPSSLFLLGESALTKVRRHMILIVPLPAQCIQLLETFNSPVLKINIVLVSYKAHVSCVWVKSSLFWGMYDSCLSWGHVHDFSLISVQVCDSSLTYHLGTCVQGALHTYPGLLHTFWLGWQVKKAFELSMGNILSKPHVLSLSSAKVFHFCK